MPIIERYGILSAGGPDFIAPSITEVTPGVTSVSFKLTNNMEEPARVYYEIGNATPTANFVDLGANTTSSTLTLTGLSENTSYTLYAQTEYEGEKTSAVSEAFTTLQITYSITQSTTSVNEGGSVTFTVSTTNFGNGTLYFTLEAVSGTVNSSDFTTAFSGSIAITNNAGSFVSTLRNDLSTEGAETFRARLRTGSTSGTVVATSANIGIGDTSLTPFFPPYFPPFFPPYFPPFFPPFFPPPYFPPYFPPFFAPPPFFPPYFAPPPFFPPFFSAPPAFAAPPSFGVPQPTFFAW